MGTLGVLIVGGILFGMFLGRSFMWYVLVPAFGFVLVPFLAEPEHTGSFLAGFLNIVVMTASFQLGYIVRLFVPASSNSRFLP
jgi:hypothetical protein